MNNKSCIQTIELLRQLALNIHGVIDVIDDRNCTDIINLLKEQEAVEPKTTITYNGFHYDYCGDCGRLLPVAQDFTKAGFCPFCGRAVKWE